MKIEFLYAQYRIIQFYYLALLDTKRNFYYKHSFKPLLVMRVIIIFLFFLINTFNSIAQPNNITHQQSYSSFIQQIDSLNNFNLQQYASLYAIECQFPQSPINTLYYGWIKNDNANEVTLLELSGVDIILPRQNIVNVLKIRVDDSLCNRIQTYMESPFKRIRLYEGCLNMPYYLISSWLNHINQIDYSKKISLCLTNEKWQEPETIRASFGNLYFNNLLLAFCHSRNYTKALYYATVLSGEAYKGFVYQNQAIALTHQLKERETDFKTNVIPDSVEWQKIKTKLNRKEQLLYLTEKLRLLNCIQNGQPSGISFLMTQYSQPADSIIRDTTVNIYEEIGIQKYKVINPYSEILQMHLNIAEIEPILPYLIDESFIPTFTFWRDFSSNRNLYKLNWVIEDILFNVTNKHFIHFATFNSLSLTQKNQVLDSIKLWCNVNKDKSEEVLLNDIMLETNDWNEFNNGMMISSNKKYKSIIQVLEKRFNDFNTTDNEYNPQESKQSIIAKTMFELGSESEVPIVSQWNKKSEDSWVTMWTDLFLLTYDKAHYNKALNSLADVLKNCDGITFYPYTIDVLLRTKEKKAMKLAEGILKKYNYIDMFYWDYYQQFVAKLLLAGSDKAFKFLYNGLNDFTLSNNEYAAFDNENNNPNLPCDSYIEVVDKWRGKNGNYSTKWDIAKRKAYSKELALWLKDQFELIQNNKTHQIKIDTREVKAPISFIERY